MKILVALTLLFGASVVLAGTQQGIITNILVRESDGLTYFHMTGTASGRPSCAAATDYWMIKDETSLAGKSQLSMLFLAYATGSSVQVTGAGTCVRWGDGEDVALLHLN